MMAATEQTCLRSPNTALPTAARLAARSAVSWPTPAAALRAHPLPEAACEHIPGPSVPCPPDSRGSGKVS